MFNNIPPTRLIMAPPRKKKVENNSNDNNVDNNNFNAQKPCQKTFGVCLIFLTFVLVGLMVYVGRSGDTFAFKPEYQINSVGVTSMKVVYNVGDNKQHLMADLDFNLTFKRRVERHLIFRGQILFNPMEVSLDQEDLFLSSTRLDPYLLSENQHQHQLQFRMQINNKTLDSSRDLSVVQFALKGQGFASWFVIPTNNCSINFLCDDIQFRILPANNFTTRSMSLVVSSLPLPCKTNSDCHRIDD